MVCLKDLLNGGVGCRHAEAERRFLEALEEAKLGFGEEDAHIASCKNNLAEFYRHTGKYDKAEELYLQVGAAGSATGMIDDSNSKKTKLSFQVRQCRKAGPPDRRSRQPYWNERRS